MVNVCMYWVLYLTVEKEINSAVHIYTLKYFLPNILDQRYFQQRYFSAHNNKRSAKIWRLPTDLSSSNLPYML